MICVIKADAYGHGAVEVANALTKAGCDYFAVSSYEEAHQLRSAGIDCNILILGRILPHEIKQAVQADIAFSVGSYEIIDDIIKSGNCGKKAKIHIKLNTGMNRTGFDAIHGSSFDELKNALETIKEHPDLFEIEGVFSHFAKAEDDKDFTLTQLNRFNDGVRFLESNGFTPKIRHISNSAGCMNYEECALDAVRLGIYLYGCESEDEKFLPVMAFHSKILEIKELEKGDGTGYGLDFIAKDKTKIAIVGAGYADGVPRSLSDSKGSVMYNGKLCPIVGRVCMDMLMIDISHIENAKTLDTVTFFGEGSGGFLPCIVQAKNAGTISYELLCAVSKRVPRLYI